MNDKLPTCVTLRTKDVCQGPSPRCREPPGVTTEPWRLPILGWNPPTPAWPGMKTTATWTADPIQVNAACLGTRPPRPPGTHHEDDRHQIGEVGREPVSPGQLHLVCLQHETGLGQQWGPSWWTGVCVHAHLCVCVGVNNVDHRNTVGKHKTPAGDE